MKKFFNVCLKLLEELRDKGDLSDWEEDYQNLSFTFQDNYGYFKELFSKEPYSTELKGNRISFKFCVEENEILRDEELYTMDFFTDNQPTKLTLSLNKLFGFGIDKNEILFLSKDAFVKHFKITRENCISFFEKADFKKFVHIYLPVHMVYENEYMKILPLQKFSVESVAQLEEEVCKNIESVQKKREDYTRIGGKYPVPTFFSIKKVDEQLLEVFQFNLFFTCLLHVSNKFMEEKFLIRGQKNIELSYKSESRFQHAEILHNIYCSVYKLEKFVQDKLEIVRNVISIYCQSEDDISILDTHLKKIEATANRYFDAYISDEVKSFLKDTKEAIELAHKHASEAREGADKVITNINTSIIAIVTAVFTAVVTMSKGDLMFLAVALGLHAFYFWISYRYNSVFVIQKKQDILSLYKISSERVPVVSESELKEIKESILDPAIENIDNNLKKYKTLTTYAFWGTIALAIVLSVVLKINPIKESPPPQPKERVLIIYAENTYDHISSIV
ncbi:hypothetical protein EXW45_23745 [Bacillus wiedmannii]|uniref:hypothetical protein n=1 Tax=Bacillus cereus group TaxID=86661 RepID=UPI0011EE60B4|nr:MULTISPECIES: hypothetical protein [Bacillus cereus group]KAA0795310.1 hypothetical protein DN394_00680 [Bacillus sp. BB081]QWH74196.1 hypothetical protein EXW45_23745 [Bacillus wiedmannii]